MNKITFKISALAIAFISIVIWVWSNASNTLNDGVSNAGEGFSKFLHIDAGHAQTIGDILASPMAVWEPLPSSIENLSFGYVPETYWLKIHIEQLPESISFLNLNYPLLDFVSYYQVKDGVILQQVATGDALVFSTRLINTNLFVFPIVETDGPSDLYLQVRSQGTLKTPITFSSVNDVAEKLQLESLAMGGYMGFMLFMIVCCFLIILIIADKDFIFYGLYVLGIALLNLNLNGVLFQWFWPDFPLLNQYSTNFISFATGFLQLVFVGRYLYYGGKRQSWLFNFGKFLGVLGFLLAFVPAWYSVVSILGAVYILLVNVFSVSMSVRSYVRKKTDRQSELYFVLAWLIMTIGICVVNLGILGILPANPFINNAAVLASMLEVFFLTAAMVDRYEHERKARLEATLKGRKESEQRQLMERHMLFQATHDSVSNLPKKQILLQHWPLIAQQIPPERQTHTAIVHFEGYYSQVLSFGQDTADAMVQELHTRVRDLVQDNAQFLVVDLDWNKDKAVALDSLDICLIFVSLLNEDVSSTLNGFHTVLSEPFTFKGMSLEMELAIGVSEVSQNEPIQNCIRRGQVASKEASQRKLNLLQYHNKLGHDPEYISALMARFKIALENDGLELAFQPQINTKDGRLFGVEALIRWHDGENGWLSPEEFIPLVEQSSLINGLTEFVIWEACKFYKNCLQHFHAPIRISINLSARNFTDKNLTRYVSETLNAFHVPPNMVTFELTETVFLGDLEASRAAFEQLLEVGVKIALDDFGIGYSSLVYLKELPFSELKIDKGFLINDSQTSQGAGLIRAAVQLGCSLDMLVIAEGVETLALASQLSSYGCDICQGYFYSKPLNELDFIRWYSGYNNKRNIIGLHYEPNEQA